MSPVPYGVLDAVYAATARAEIELQLRTADVSEEFQLAGKDEAMELRGSHGCTPVALSTGLPAVVKRSDRTVQGASLGDVGLTWVRNEAAAYEVAKLIGCDDLVVPTVLREGQDEHGRPVAFAVRLFVEAPHGGVLGDEGSALNRVPTEQIERAALFDYLVHQTDRHGRNWYVVETPTGDHRLLLFDHQLCFRDWQGLGLRSGPYDIAGHRIAKWAARAAALLTQQAAETLSPLLSAEDLAELQARARLVVGSNP